MSAARVIPFPQTARSHAKQMETRGMALLLGELLALLVGVAVGISYFPGPPVVCY